MSAPADRGERGPARKKRCPDFARILRDTPPTAALREQVASCFYKEMKRIAMRRCGDAAMAEDAHHDALAAALTGLGSYRGDGPLVHWLSRLVRTACSRLRRGRKNDPDYNRPLDDLLPEQEADPSAGSQELQTLLGERLGLLAAALREVPEPGRSLFLLHEGEDRSLAELAARFSLTEEAVKSRLKRIRARLRKQLLAKAEEEV